MEIWATMLNTAFFPKNVNSKAEQTAEIYLENLQKYLGRYPNSGPALLTISLSMFAATFARNCLFSNPVLQPLAPFQRNCKPSTFQERERELESLKASRMSEVGGSLGYIVSIPAYHYHQASQSHHNNVTENMRWRVWHFRYHVSFPVLSLGRKISLVAPSNLVRVVGHWVWRKIFGEEKYFFVWKKDG